MPVLTPLPARTGAGGITDAATTIGQQKENLGDLRDFMEYLLGADGEKLTAISALRILDPQALYNAKLTFASAAHVLTATLKGNDGNALSAENLCLVAQRNAALNDGSVNLRKITANVALAISNGSTLGHASGVAGRLYWYLLEKDANTPKLAVAGSFQGLSGLYTTVAEGGGGAADSATVMYADEALANKPGRLAFITADTQAAAGVWDALPTEIRPGPFGAEGVGAASLLAGALWGQVGMVNGTVVTSRAGNAETVAIKTLAGADPSPADPVLFTFRNSAAGTGDYVTIAAVAALAVTLSSGSDIGASNGVPFRLWLVAFNDAGTLRLGLVNCLAADLSIMALKDDDLNSSTAEGGAGAADAAQVIYTGAAVAAKAMRVAGYLEYTLAAKGTWNTAPSKVQLFGAGVPLPGQIVQEPFNQTGAATTGATPIPTDDTIPQNTEGVQFMSQVATPRSAPNVLEIVHVGVYAFSVDGVVLGCALFQDAIAGALAAVGALTKNGSMVNVKLRHRMLAGGTAAKTFKVRAGGDIAGTTTFNGHASARIFGGVMASSLGVKEIMA